MPPGANAPSATSGIRGARFNSPVRAGSRGDVESGLARENVLRQYSHLDQSSTSSDDDDYDRYSSGEERYFGGLDPAGVTPKEQGRGVPAHPVGGLYSVDAAPKEPSHGSALSHMASVVTRARERNTGHRFTRSPEMTGRDPETVLRNSATRFITGAQPSERKAFLRVNIQDVSKFDTPTKTANVRAYIDVTWRCAGLSEHKDVKVQDSGGKKVRWTDSKGGEEGDESSKKVPAKVKEYHPMEIEAGKDAAIIENLEKTPEDWESWYELDPKSPERFLTMGEQEDPEGQGLRWVSYRSMVRALSFCICR